MRLEMKDADQLVAEIRQDLQNQQEAQVNHLLATIRQQQAQIHQLQSQSTLPRQSRPRDGNDPRDIPSKIASDASAYVSGPANFSKQDATRRNPEDSPLYSNFPAPTLHRTSSDLSMRRDRRRNRSRGRGRSRDGSGSRSRSRSRSRSPSRSRTRSRSRMGLRDMAALFFGTAPEARPRRLSPPRRPSSAGSSQANSTASSVPTQVSHESTSEAALALQAMKRSIDACTRKLRRIPTKEATTLSKWFARFGAAYPRRYRCLEHIEDDRLGFRLNVLASQVEDNIQKPLRYADKSYRQSLTCAIEIMEDVEDCLADIGDRLEPFHLELDQPRPPQLEPQDYRRNPGENALNLGPSNGSREASAERPTKGKAKKLRQFLFKIGI